MEAVQTIGFCAVQHRSTSNQVHGLHHSGGVKRLHPKLICHSQENSVSSERDGEQ